MLSMMENRHFLVPDQMRNTVEKMFLSVLRPVSKILVKNGFLLPSSIELLKRALVEAAIAEGAETDSLISLRTGVHRKDVKRLRLVIDARLSEKSPIRGLALLISVWSNDARFRDAEGQPRVLGRTADSAQLGFDDLVRVSKVDLAPATVLQELVAQSLVAIDAEGRITLLSRTFVAQSGDAALKAFEATLIDHLRIAAENVLSPAGAPRKFDQVVRYSHLSDTSVEMLEAEARKLARAYLEHMNAMAYRLQSEDDASGQLAAGRFVSGVFVAPTPSHPDTTADKSASAARSASRKDRDQ